MASQQMISAGRIWDFLFGKEEVFSSNEFPLAVSLCYYTSTIIFGRVLRIINKNVTPKSLQPFLADMIVTFQVCACSLENVMIRNHYGTLGYALALFILGTWATFTIQEGFGNPCANVAGFMKGGQGLPKTLLRIALQLAGGLISYRWAQGFWYLGLTDGHAQRFRMLHCNAVLSVPFPVGLAVEFGGTLIDMLLALTLFTPFDACEKTTKIAINVIMTLMGVHMTGIYLNPVNASNQEFACRGVSAFEHIIIYWVGPLVAAGGAVWLQRHLKELAKTVLTRENIPGKSYPVNGKPKASKSNGQDSPTKKSTKANSAVNNNKEKESKRKSPSKTRQRKNAKKAS